MATKAKGKRERFAAQRYSRTPLSLAQAKGGASIHKKIPIEFEYFERYQRESRAIERKRPNSLFFYRVIVFGYDSREPDRQLTISVGDGLANQIAVSVADEIEAEARDLKVWAHFMAQIKDKSYFVPRFMELTYTLRKETAEDLRLKSERLKITRRFNAERRKKRAILVKRRATIARKKKT